MDYSWLSCDNFFFLLIQVVVDEEQEANATESPFKSTISNVFNNILIAHGTSMNEVKDKSSRGILKWFKYLTSAFLPTLPIWSNLLLGNILYFRAKYQ